MKSLENIFTRRSIRKYKDETVSLEQIQIILRAAMYAPSAANAQPWHFIVIDDRAILDRIPTIHQYANMVHSAPLAIVVCGDLDKEKFPGRWPLDCSAATQNMMLAAHAMGIGSVWVGIYPDEKNMKDFRRLLNLPNHIMPLALVPMGYSESIPKQPERFDETKIRNNKW